MSKIFENTFNYKVIYIFKIEIEALSKTRDTLGEDFENLVELVLSCKGKVIVTNSPYDHFDLGDSPEDPTYEFRRLLEGVPAVIKPPAIDERLTSMPSMWVSAYAASRTCATALS